jgi:hypothetical protein
VVDALILVRIFDAFGDGGPYMLTRKVFHAADHRESQAGLKPGHEPNPPGFRLMRRGAPAGRFGFWQCNVPKN